MPKNLVILYLAGSCGDLISIPWISTRQFYSVIAGHTLLDSGRVKADFNKEFINQFPKQPYLHHYARDWTNDINKLKNIDKPFLILTGSIAQANLFKNYFSSNVHVLTINYSESLWQFVATNFCTKILDYPNYLTNDDIGENFLNKVANSSARREQFLELGRAGQLGHWYAEHLTAGNLNFPPKEFKFQGDSTLLLDEILDFNRLTKKLLEIADDIGITLDLEYFSNIYHIWRTKQFQPTHLDSLFIK
jgi:hypothetical protein